MGRGRPLLHSRHRGPLLLMWFLAVLEKNLYRGAMDDEENVARRSAAMMGRLKSIWPAVWDVHVTVPRSQEPLWARRLLLYRDAVQQAARVPSAFAGVVRGRQRPEQLETSKISHLWWLLLDVVREAVPAQVRQDAFRELADDLTRDLVCGLPPAVYSDYTGSASKGSASKGSATKGKGKGKSTKGYGSGATAAGAPAAAGGGNNSSLQSKNASPAGSSAGSSSASSARRASSSPSLSRQSSSTSTLRLMSLSSSPRANAMAGGGGSGAKAGGAGWRLL